MDVGKRSLFRVHGNKVNEVYRVKGAVAHCRRNLRSTIALFQFVLIKLGIIIFGQACLHSRTDSWSLWASIVDIPHSTAI